MAHSFEGAQYLRQVTRTELAASTGAVAVVGEPNVFCRHDVRVSRSFATVPLMQAIVDQLTSLANDFDARVQATPADAWSNQSPCEGWTARDVVVHLAGNYNRLSGHHQPIGDEENIVESWVSAKARLEHMMTGDLSVEFDGPFGKMPMSMFLGRFMSTDTLVHTFDLARAVGGDEHLNQDAVAMAYSGLKPMGDGIRRPGAFGAATPCADDAPLQTQFLCHVGRPV